MVKIVWTEASINDLREIFEYISEDSIRYANLTINRIYQGSQIVTTNPNIGKIVREFNNPYIRELIFGNYRAIYRIKSDKQVNILRVFHSARLLRRIK